MSVTLGFPSVTVPVLSRTTVVAPWTASRASADLINIPDWAPLPVPTIIAVGVANPKAQGQLMTNTAIPKARADSTGCPLMSQITVDKRAIAITMGTKTAL